MKNHLNIKTENPPLIGWCGTPDKAGAIHQAGLDYLELQLVPLGLEDDLAFQAALSMVKSLPLPVPVMSYLFPHDLRLVGEEVDERRARHYMDRVARLMQTAGAEKLVYGSGWTRNIPKGFDAKKAQHQYVNALTWMAQSLPKDSVLIIEPLNRKESNQCNLVRDGVRMAKLTGLGHVKGLADFYHMDEENESLSVISEFGADLGHIHLADTGRLNPGTGRYDHLTFLRHLKHAGYQGLLSCECAVQGEPVPAMQFSADFLRKTWQMA